MTQDEIHKRALELFRERTTIQLNIRREQARLVAIEREINDLEKARSDEK